MENHYEFFDELAAFSSHMFTVYDLVIKVLDFC